MVTRQWLGGLRRVCWLLVVMWVVQGLNSYLGLAFNDLGIYPREWWSLPGVVLWPFLHGGIAHLLMNSLALLMLGFFVALRGGGVFYKASLLIVVLGGLGVWMIGRPAYHIGASGLAFGYFGFLVAVAFYEKRASSLLVAGLVLFYYSGMIFGVLPQNSFISWEGHLFGMMAGIFAARLLARRPPPSRTLLL